MEHQVIVSRHPATVEWLKSLIGEDVPVLAEATEDDVRGKVVYGNLPLHLACVAKAVYAVEFTGTPPRGKEYSREEMEKAGVQLRGYRVQAL